MVTRVLLEGKTKISVVILGFMLILIPSVIGFLLCMPEFGQWIMASKGELFKGVIIGLSVLPILLFVTIKGGGRWYRTWWTWGVLMGVAVLLVIIIFISKSNLSHNGDDGMGGAFPNNEPTMGKSIPMG